MIRGRETINKQSGFNTTQAKLIMTYIDSFFQKWMKRKKKKKKGFLTSNGQILQVSTLVLFLSPWVFSPFFSDFVFGTMTSIVLCNRETILNLDKEMHLISKLF